MIFFDSDQSIQSTEIDSPIAFVVGNSLNFFRVIPLGSVDIFKTTSESLGLRLDCENIYHALFQKMQIESNCL
jgi:hypothetical protein